MINDEIGKTNYAKGYKQSMAFPGVQKYVRKSAVLCWKMALQRPKMWFKSAKQDEKYDETTQDPFYGSKDPFKHRVLYTVKPALYHGDALNIKAKVICG